MRNRVGDRDFGGNVSTKRSKASDFDHASRFFYAPILRTHPRRSHHIRHAAIPTPNNFDYVMKLLTSIAIIEKIHTEHTTPLLAASAAPIISAAYHKNMPTIAPPAGASAYLCIERATNLPWFAFMSLLFPQLC